MKKYVFFLMILIVFSTVEAQNPQIKGNNLFAFKLYQKLNTEKQNLVFSPFSIRTALAMTYLGAKGNTKIQMDKIMNFGDNDTAFASAYTDFTNKILQNSSTNTTIRAANKIWMQSDYKFTKQYINNLRKYFGVTPETANFIDPKTRRKTIDKINKWVEKQTEKKIRNLIAPDAVDDATRLILVNALYFKSKWQKTFNKNMTYTDEFTVDDDSSMVVKYMHAKSTFKYSDNDNYLFVQIPYESGNFVMNVFMPKPEKNSLRTIKKFSVEDYNNLINSAKYTKIDLHLPIFEFVSNFELSEKLQKLGMKDPFDNKADFRGITGGKELKISKILHKAYIAINEDGTEAAASTAVIMTRKIAVVDKGIFFKVDRPFVFTITHTKTGAILFLGNVKYPSDAE